jgi:hypothetical protein
MWAMHVCASADHGALILADSTVHRGGGQDRRQLLCAHHNAAPNKSGCLHSRVPLFRPLRHCSGSGMFWRFIALCVWSGASAPRVHSRDLQCPALHMLATHGCFRARCLQPQHTGYCRQASAALNQSGEVRVKADDLAPSLMRRHSLTPSC